MNQRVTFPKAQTVAIDKNKTMATTTSMVAASATSTGSLSRSHRCNGHANAMMKSAKASGANTDSAFASAAKTRIVVAMTNVASRPRTLLSSGPSDTRTPVRALFPPIVGLRPLTQAETDADPARSCENEIDAEEQPQDVKARNRPVRQDDDAEKERDETRYERPDPHRLRLHAESEKDAHDPRRHERRAKQRRGADSRRRRTPRRYRELPAASTG